MAIDENEIQNRLTFLPASRAGMARHAKLTAAGIHFLAAVNQYVPDGREKALAMTKIEEAKMWASAGVARNPETV